MINSRHLLRILSIALAVIITSGALFSCGNNKNESSTRTTTTLKPAQIVTTSGGGDNVPDRDRLSFTPFEIPDGGNTVKVLSFDCAVTGDTDTADFVKNYLPDIFSVQNATKAGVEQISSGIEGYAYFGSSDYDADGTYNAIFFKASDFEVLKNQVIGLSDDPLNKDRKGAGLVYALFYSAKADCCIAVFNTSIKGEGAEDQLFYLYSKYTCYTNYYPVIVTCSADIAEGSAGSGLLTGAGKLNVDEQKDNSIILSGKTQKSASAALGADTLNYAVPAAALKLLPPEKEFDSSKKMIALTFDDGPTSTDGYTNKILAALEEHNAKATFFMLGQRLTEGNPIQRSLLKQAFESGHEIGNHTYDHKLHYYEFENDEKLNENLAMTDALIAEVTGGAKSTVLRPPGGIVKKSVNVSRPIVDWSIDTVDWDTSKVSSKDVYDTIVKKAKDGSIVLMHDVKKNSPNMLSDLLSWLDDNGFICVTVSELMEFHDIQMKPGNIYLTTEETGRTTFG